MKQIQISQGTLQLEPDFMTVKEADSLFQSLQQQLDWQQAEIRMFGRMVRIPRLQCFQGDPGISYRYSGLSLQTEPWHPLIHALKQRVESIVHHTFNTVLINYYRDGKDSMGWHSDDEPELGSNPVIASLSLGATRCFKMKHKTKTDLQPISLNLPSGSLLVMSGSTQTHWLHQITKTKKSVGRRINLTFRFIYQ